MSDVTVPLTAKVAQAIILGIADAKDGYNKAWAWWAHEGIEENAYFFGNESVTLVQRVYPDDQWHNEYHGDTEIELVFRIQDHFFRISGEYSSYGADEWSGQLREVKPTKVTRQVFEVI